MHDSSGRRRHAKLGLARRLDRLGTLEGAAGAGRRCRPRTAGRPRRRSARTRSASRSSSPRNTIQRGRPSRRRRSGTTQRQERRRRTPCARGASRGRSSRLWTRGRRVKRRSSHGQRQSTPNTTSGNSAPPQNGFGITRAAADRDVEAGHQPQRADQPAEVPVGLRAVRPVGDVVWPPQPDRVDLHEPAEQERARAATANIRPSERGAWPGNIGTPTSAARSPRRAAELGVVARRHERAGAARCSVADQRPGSSEHVRDVHARPNARLAGKRAAPDRAARGSRRRPGSRARPRSRSRGPCPESRSSTSE